MRITHFSSNNDLIWSVKSSCLCGWIWSTSSAYSHKIWLKWSEGTGSQWISSWVKLAGQDKWYPCISPVGDILPIYLRKISGSTTVSCLMFRIISEWEVVGENLVTYGWLYFGSYGNGNYWAAFRNIVHCVSQMWQDTCYNPRVVL